MILDALIAAAAEPVPAPSPAPTVMAAGVRPGERAPSPSRAQRATTAAAIVPVRWRGFARCIVLRESHDNPRARNPHSSAQGIAQWLDRAWRRGLAHMVAQRLHEYGLPWTEARALREWLRGREIATWPRTYQEIGLAASLADGNWRPWYLAGSRCNGLVAR